MTSADSVRLPPSPAPWPTIDPFLFCVHHNDRYPAGTAELGPAAPLTGRQLGQDFAGRDGWNMYHGLVLPGFPAHPHRGFETVTFARHGYIDHSDSLGAAARFGRGDVQWMTAGSGIVHAEMFPLLDPAGPNHTELFQIWLNLPAADKMVAPHFAMLWSQDIPRAVETDAAGRSATITVLAGPYGELVPPPPPPASWASRPEAEVAIWHLVLDAGASCRLPTASPGVERALYLFEGAGATVDGITLADRSAATVDATRATEVTAGDEPVELLVLQGRPIGEPVAQYGPFVMTSEDEIRQAFADYQRTQFGGWPWPDEAPHHGPSRGRFARHADGRAEEADTPAAR